MSKRGQRETQCQNNKAGSAGDKGWGRGNEGSSNTPAVSQGAWDRGPEGEYGSAGVGGGSGNLATGSSGGGRGGGSSNSSSSGASGGGGVGGGGGGVSQDSASPTFAMTRAWDNQKPVEAGEGGVEEWGGQGGGGVGGGSREGSGDPNNQQEHSSHRHRSQPGPNAEVALQSMLSRTDLDPRVLSNTGWGQTQIRQNVAWDLEARSGGGRRAEAIPGLHLPHQDVVGLDPSSEPTFAGEQRIRCWAQG